jgi:hypothetical protein
VANDWTRAEVEALVADYLVMLIKELRDEPFSKTEHRRVLSRLLDGRSDGSIERKHQNVSAILIELGFPFIFGYKPLENYQSLLYEVTADRLSADPSIVKLVREAVEAPAPSAPLEAADPKDLLDRWESPPTPSEPVRYPALREGTTQRRPPVNYLEREARNISLGRAGEEFVVRFERARLIRAGRDALADRIEHTAVNQGDGAGFDVRSFETNGRDRLIEVKTTAYGKQTPFFLSRNELRVSREFAPAYHLYRLFRFRSEPKLYGLTGALDEVCVLDPVEYSARVR